MAIRTQIRLVQLTGSLDDTVSAETTSDGPDAASLQGVLDQAAAAIKRITGGTTYASQPAGVFTQTIKSSAPGTHDLGAADGEWNDLFLGDSAEIQLGLDQDTKLTHVPDTGILLNSSRQLQFGDSGTYINQSTNGQLDVQGDVKVKVTGPTTEIEASSVLLVDSPIADFEDAGVVLKFGALGAKESLTHIAGAGLRMAGSGSFQFRDADLSIGSDANGQLDLKADTEIEMTTPLVEISGDLTVQGNDLDFAAGAVNINASGGNGVDTAIGSAGGAGGLKVMYNRIKNSGAQEMMTFSGQEVIIPGDLTVKGATTTIDTTNLEVEDKIIGMNYTSGSTAGALGDAGLIVGNSGGTQRAWYYDTGDSRWAAVETNDAPTATSITPTAYLAIDVLDLHLNGLDIFGDGTGAAITLTTGDTPNVGIINNLTIADDKSVVFGADSDASIKYDEASSDKLQILAGGNGSLMSVSAGDIVLGHSGIGAAALGDVLKIAKVGTVGHVQVSGSITSFGTQQLHLSSAAGTPLHLQSAADLKFVDNNKPASWSDVNGIKLSAGSAEWSNFESNFGGEVSLLAAINQAANPGSTVLQKRVVEVGAAGIGAGSDVELNADLSALSPTDILERVDVFVNGQLMLSGADASGNGDYQLDHTGGLNDTDAKFQFALVQDDVVCLVVR